MEEWLRDTSADKVMYCGDGGGDYEGAMRVPAGGVIFARKGWSLHRRLAEAQAQGVGPRATIREWESQVQLASLLLDEIGLVPATLYQ